MDHGRLRQLASAPKRKKNNDLRKKAASPISSVYLTLLMILGLTGGIGCGKSTAAQIFESKGFRRIDCDAVVRDEVLTDPAIISQIQARFGSTVLRGDAVDRVRLGELVFANPHELRWLEALVHPQVSARWRARVAASPTAAWVIEIPLLFEKGLEKGFDFIACVACSPSVQLARLELRGMTRTHAAQRISQQLPLARKIDLSDFVLSNDGAQDFLQRQIDLLVSRWNLGPRCASTSNS